MATRDISFNEFSPDIQQLLNQSLKAVLAQAAEIPTIFCTYGGRDEPTLIETEHTTEIIREALTDQMIYYGAENFIADALRFVIWDISNWLGGRDDTQSIEDAMLEYAIKFGVTVTQTTIVELHCLARSLCPHAEISATVRVDDETNAYSAFCEAFKEQIKSTSVDYGQHNIGVVVDGVMFDFVRDHPFITKLKELL